MPHQIRWTSTGVTIYCWSVLLAPATMDCTTSYKLSVCHRITITHKTRSYKRTVSIKSCGDRRLTPSINRIGRAISATNKTRRAIRYCNSTSHCSILFTNLLLRSSEIMASRLCELSLKQSGTNRCTENRTINY